MIKKIDLLMKQETEAKKKLEEAKQAAKHVKQLIPVGVDPKTVQCVNFANGTCDKGGSCQFGHFTKKEVRKEEPEAEERPRGVCRFLLDAVNAGEYGPGWACPFPACRGIHKLVEIDGDGSVDISLEEYIELQRQTIDEAKGTPVTQETFSAWKARKQREDELHAKRVAALRTGARGVDLFLTRPEMFEDDAEVAEDVDYTARNYECSDDEQTCAATEY